MTTLCTRPARQLTDLEIAKILCGIVGGLMEESIRPDDMRNAITGFLAVVERRSPPNNLPVGPWVSALGGAVGAVVNFCERANVINALNWILDNWNDIAAEQVIAAVAHDLEAEHGALVPDPQSMDQAAREQFGRDLLDAHRAARDVSDGAATRAMLVELGLRGDAIDEFSLVSALLGMTMGTMIDDGCSVADVQRSLLGNNHAALHALPITAERRNQLVVFIEFGRGQFERLCAPGSCEAVLAALIAIFARTLGAVGLVTSEAVH